MQKSQHYVYYRKKWNQRQDKFTSTVYASLEREHLKTQTQTVTFKEAKSKYITFYIANDSYLNETELTCKFLLSPQSLLIHVYCLGLLRCYLHFPLPTAIKELQKKIFVGFIPHLILNAIALVITLRIV